MDLNGGYGKWKDFGDKVGGPVSAYQPTHLSEEFFFFPYSLPKTLMALAQSKQRAKVFIENKQYIYQFGNNIWFMGIKEMPHIFAKNSYCI